MRFHDNAVNAVAWLKDGRIVTAGADAHIAIWTPGRPRPDKVLDGHSGPIVDLALSPDGKTLASASWDHTVRLWPLAGGEPRVLSGNAQNVNGVAFSPDGKQVISAGYDATLRIWQLGRGGGVIVRNLPTPLNSVAVAPDGEIVSAGADGKVYFLSPQGEMRAEVQAAATPIISVALSHDGKLVAAAGMRGSVAIVERKARKLARTLIGPGLPVWSVAFFPDDKTLLTGGTDRMIRRWNVTSGEPMDRLIVGAPDDPLKHYAGDLRRAGVPPLRRLPHAEARRGPARRPLALAHFRPPHRHAAGLQFLAGAEEARHRLVAGDGVEAVRDRSGALHARHQDAGADHRLGGGPQGAGGFPRTGDDREETVSRARPARLRHGRARPGHARLTPP